MAMKVKHVARAQKDQGHCQVCGAHLIKGTPYKHAKGRYTPKMVRCETCPEWRRSQLDTSKLATALAAQEEATDSLQGLDFDSYSELSAEKAVEAFLGDVKGIVDQCASGGRDCAGEYQEGLDNMPEGLQQGPTGEGIQEKIDALEAWADGLEEFEPDEDLEAHDNDWIAYCGAIVEEAQELVDALEA